jgi:ABC-type uncharacterized transport system auxiliary subunit
LVVMRPAAAPTRLVRLAAAMALALVLAACASKAAPSAQAPGTAAQAATATVAPATQPPAILQFKAPLVAGGALDGTTFTGKPVAFWFWAPW